MVIDPTLALETPPFLRNCQERCSSISPASLSVPLPLAAPTLATFNWNIDYSADSPAAPAPEGKKPTKGGTKKGRKVVKKVAKKTPIQSSDLDLIQDS
jgi:hypothetical protein